VPGRLRLEAGIAEGWVRPPEARRQKAWRRFRAGGGVADLLAEDRGA
jgi:hypothetical protein